MAIPQLKLQAAALASRLKTTVWSELKVDDNQVSLLSDCCSVLKYIENENASFVQKIMQRTKKSKNNSNQQDRCYIPSDLNAVDDCTEA